MADSYEDDLRAAIQQAEDNCFNLYQQIEQLEAQVAGLKQALALYLKRAPKATEPLPATQQRTPARRQKRRGARFDEILRFIEQSGEMGVTIEEMYHFAVTNGLKLKRTSIRSNVWNHKNGRILEGMGDGRYRKAQHAVMDQASAPQVSPQRETGAVAAPASSSTH